MYVCTSDNLAETFMYKKVTKNLHKRNLQMLVNFVVNKIFVFNILKFEKRE